MSDPDVGQLAALLGITAAQLRDHPSRRVGIRGIAAGNGLDALDETEVDSVSGYDINADYLEACRSRYEARFGDRMHLIECSIDRSLAITPTDLLIANLLIEYIGIDEFAAFVAANTTAIGVPSCVTQRNGEVGVVSKTKYSSAFVGLESIASEVDPDALAAALSAVGWFEVSRSEHPLPNGKVLTRQDFAATS
ncbi:hypothetical protein [Microbacterium saccharophilum]|nr:hypothetical protein [Microbacterium saccharophilum]